MNEVENNLIRAVTVIQYTIRLNFSFDLVTIRVFSFFYKVILNLA